MYFTQIFIFASLALTAVAGLYDKSVPYFPIEISRTAAGPLGQYVFPVSMILVFGIAVLESASWTQLAPFCGLTLLSVVSDVQSWKVHMLGVALMAFGVIIQVAARPSREALAAIACAAVLYVVRIAMKMIITSSDPLTDFTSLAGLAALKAKCLAIMFTGRASEMQLIVYKIAGVMQWLVFVIFVKICINKS